MKQFAIGVAAIVALVTPAVAADIPVKAPPAAPPAAYTWNGLYVGSAFGAGWSDEAVSFSANDPVSAALLNGTLGFVGEPPVAGVRVRQAGPVSGIEAGYNWQTGANWLLGLETDFSIAKIDGLGSSTSTLLKGTATQGVTAAQKTDWYGTIRGRVGWLATPNLLLFGTGGFAYGRVADSANFAFGFPGILTFNSGTIGGFSFICAANAPCFSGSSTTTRTGWTVGGGAEQRFDQHWSAKIEYQFVDLGTDTVRLTAVLANPASTPSSFNVAFRDRFNVIRVGMNYRF
jgi:outer membrane immunogenic protein